MAAEVTPVGIFDAAKKGDLDSVKAIIKARPAEVVKRDPAWNNVSILFIIYFFFSFLEKA